MKKILICIDNSLYSMKVAEEGILIAKSMNAEISFIHVVNVNSGEKVAVQAALESRKIKARKVLENILARFSCAALIYIDEGNPSERIVTKTKMLEADLVVMGNNERKGKLPGKVVKDVVRQLKKRVVLV